MKNAFYITIAGWLHGKAFLIFLVNSFHFKLCFKGPFDRRTAVEDASGFGPPWHFDYPLQKAAFLAPWAVSFPLVVSAFHLAFPLGIFLLLVLLFCCQ